MGKETPKSNRKMRRIIPGINIGLVAAFLCLSPGPTAGATGSPDTPRKMIADDLEAEIGQMIMVGFRGLAADDQSPIIQDIKERHIGGVILFDYDVPRKSPLRNVASPAQLKKLTSALQRASTIPLFIAVDQEGGKVNRLKPQLGFPEAPSQQYLGTLDDLKATRSYAEITATTLRDLGINLNLAPVVDLNRDPENPIVGKIERSFSADPRVVIGHALAVIGAAHDQGISCAIKHFPGHGSSRDDSHQGLVDVTGTWSPIELEPFSAIIQSGQCDAVMTAHLFNRNLDAAWPATLSAPTITGILRRQLGFEEVVISDDLQMGAIRSYYGLETAIRTTILAGVDILLFANNSVFEEDIAAQATEIVNRLVEDRSIPRERIHESYLRIVRLKGKLQADARRREP